LAIRAQTHPLLPHPWLGRLLGSLVRARGVLGSLEVPPNIFIDSIIAYLYFYQKVVYASESPSLRVRVQVRTHTHTHTHTPAYHFEARKRTALFGLGKEHS
jgi:hypothetical protein